MMALSSRWFRHSWPSSSKRKLQMRRLVQSQQRLYLRLLLLLQWAPHPNHQSLWHHRNPQSPTQPTLPQLLTLRLLLDHFIAHVHRQKTVRSPKETKRQCFCNGEAQNVPRETTPFCFCSSNGTLINTPTPHTPPPHSHLNNLSLLLSQQGVLYVRLFRVRFGGKVISKKGKKKRK